MKPATRPPARRDDVRMLIVDDRGEGTDSPRDGRIGDLLRVLQPGDVLIVNDAATLPASLRGGTSSGEAIELRLLGPVPATAGSARDAEDSATWTGVLFGAGDWQVATEDRQPPPLMRDGDTLHFAGDLTAAVIGRPAISERLIELRFDRHGAALWQALYRAGRPVQYSYLEDNLELWSVQTVYGSRPWAMEMPSAGRPLSWSLLLALRRRGVEISSITHGAGLSSTGDPAIDRILPLPERFDIPEATVQAIFRARSLGRRVIAVGTTVVRALEGSAAQNGGVLAAGAGITDLVMDGSFRPRVVDGLLSGVHDPSESHFRLLNAFADRATLLRAWQTATRRGYCGHEFGDTTLIMRPRPGYCTMTGKNAAVSTGESLKRAS